MRYFMEGLSGKAACHLYAIFKQCVLSTFFSPELFTEIWRFLYITLKDGNTNWGGKKSLLFLNTNISVDQGEVISVGQWIHLSAPPAADPHPAGCFVASLALALCGFSSCWSISRALHMNTVTGIPAPLGGVQSPIMLSGSRVFRPLFQHLTEKSIANPSMQQYLVLKTPEKVRTGGKTVPDRSSSLHLLGSALNLSGSACSTHC